MSTQRAVILSDIHLNAAGTVFREERALCGFLDHLAALPRCELVLAGDVFDFLLTPGYDGFSPERAPRHLQDILDKHQGVVTALTRFAARPDHEVTLLAGNHDPEVLLPAVRARFEEAIGRRGSVRYDEELLPGPGDRWAVYGRALPGAVWVVHGDRWDPANAIDRAAILAGETPPLPAGSELVSQILAPLYPKRPWIYEIKPEVHGILPLLLYLDPPGTLGYLKTHHQLSERLLLNRLQGALGVHEHLYGPTAPAAPAAPDSTEALLQALVTELRAEGTAQRTQLLMELEQWLRRGPPAPGTLAPHGGVGRWLLRAWIRHLGQGRGHAVLDLQADDELRAPAQRDAAGHAQVVIAGHTHGPRLARDDDAPAYLNSGTWIPVGDIPEGPVDEVIDRLEAGGPWPAQTPRTFVMVEDGRPWLGACDGDGVPGRSA